MCALVKIMATPMPEGESNARVLDAVLLGQHLSRVRADLKRLLAARNGVATVIGTTKKKTNRSLRSALLAVIAGSSLLPQFRIHADNVACLLEDVSVATVEPRCAIGVDTCFGRTLFGSNPAAPQSNANDDARMRAAISVFETRAKAFMRSVRSLPHESARTRLDKCEARFYASWQRVVEALR